MNARLSLASTNAPGGAATSSSSAEDPNRRLAGLLLELARCVNPEMAATLPPPPQVDPRMEAMRDVLMQREKEALTRLQKKIDDPREFADAIGAVLPAAFMVAAEQDEQLAQVIAPTVERATQASIRKNPRTMVDILYPVMGPAIRKAIAETLEGTLQSLNQAIKYSLSWRGLKWRIEAWRSGSSFADVVLRHTAVFQVDHLFLVHRKTSLLIAHVAREDAAARDPQLVSAMLSAIQDFVRDSFDESASKDAGTRSIDSLRLGDLLLWCEEGPQAFLAAVIHGDPRPCCAHGWSIRWRPSMTSGARRSPTSKATPSHSKPWTSGLRPASCRSPPSSTRRCRRCCGPSRWHCCWRWAGGSRSG